MNATLSFNGLLTGYPELFSGLQAPASIDKDSVVNALLLDTMELEVLIPNPKIMQQALSIYSVQMLPSWTRYAHAMGLDYTRWILITTPANCSTGGRTTAPGHRT